jgi:hypothetical protein
MTILGCARFKVDAIGVVAAGPFGWLRTARESGAQEPARPASGP